MSQKPQPKSKGAVMSDKNRKKANTLSAEKRQECGKGLGAYLPPMKNRYPAVVVHEGKWFMAICPEVPEANGQGKTREACLEDLAAAIETVLNYKREKSMQGIPRGAEQTAVLV
jgi:predicted RNase H-like HicB family nuclease